MACHQQLVQCRLKQQQQEEIPTQGGIPTQECSQHLRPSRSKLACCSWPIVARLESFAALLSAEASSEGNAGADGIGGGGGCTQHERHRSLVIRARHCLLTCFLVYKADRDIRARRALTGAAVVGVSSGSTVLAAGAGAPFTANGFDTAVGAATVGAAAATVGAAVGAGAAQQRCGSLGHAPQRRLSCRNLALKNPALQTEPSGTCQRRHCCWYRHNSSCLSQLRTYRSINAV